MEKIIVKENVIRQLEIIDKVNETIIMLNKELPVILKKIGILKLTNEIFEDLFTGNASETEKDYYTKVDRDLAKLATEAIKTRLYWDSESCFNNFLDAYTSIKKRSKHLEFITINQAGECELSKENEEKIMECARVSISDKKEIEMYKTHCEAANLLNKMFKGNIPLHWHGLFTVKSGGQIIPNEDTDYNSLVMRAKS